jgi:hypothetical protein
MLKRLIAAAAFLAVPGVVFAQGGGGRGGMGGGMMNPLQVVLDKKADLNLSADQVAKIEELKKALEEQNRVPMAEMQKIRQAHPERGAMPEEERTKMRAQGMLIQQNNTAAREKLKDVLNAEQLVAANKAIDEARPMRGRRGGARHRH